MTLQDDITRMEGLAQSATHKFWSEQLEGCDKSGGMAIIGAVIGERDALKAMHKPLDPDTMLAVWAVVRAAIPLLCTEYRGTERERLMCGDTECPDCSLKPALDTLAERLAVKE